MDRPGCFCCKARTCLIVWSCLALFGVLYSVVPITTPGSFQNSVLVVSILNAILGALLYGFILFSAVKKHTRFLKVSFWLVLTYMALSVVVAIITAVRYKAPDGTKVPLASFIISAIVSIGIVGGLLAWTVKRTLNEVEDEHGQGYNVYNA